jgi:glutamate racemase
MTSSRRIDELQVEARYHRERYDLYRAKVYGPRATSPARLRELERACQAAEARLRGEPVDPAVFARAATGLRSQPGGEAIDTVVLACTHFPLVEAELAAAFGSDVRFVHGAEGIARRIAHLTESQPFARSQGDLALFTRSGEDVATLVPLLSQYGLKRIEIL